MNFLMPFYQIFSELSSDNDSFEIGALEFWNSDLELNERFWKKKIGKHQIIIQFCPVWVH